MSLSGYLPILSVALLLTGTAHADAPDYCKDQARELTMTAWNEILPDMTASQRSDLQALAVDICTRHAGAAADEIDAARSSEAGGDSDWFTDYVLEGKPADKPGNRRLERRSRY